MRRALPLLVPIVVLLSFVSTAAAGEGGGASAPQARQAPPSESGGAVPADPRLRAERRKRDRLAAARRARRLSARRETGHRFPLVGTYSYGSSGARFGAPRRGHIHQGQDLAAAEGTPIVAPRGGVVKAVAYQARGAGHYVVLDGSGEDRDYVFMHMRTGSVAVTKGQSVRLGQTLGEVGNTGRSFGAHLHFEIWVGGGWYTGGRPVDPLPYLRIWESLTRP